MRIGIIQTRGMGDIIIAAPIAMHWVDRGHEVLWPIDSEFLEAFTYALPSIQFLPVDRSITGNNTASYFVEHPKELLSNAGCEKVHVLYSHLTGYEFPHSTLSTFLSFDRYKYAVAEVPFAEKWNLKIRRNREREMQLFETLSLSPQEEYIVMQDTGSNYKTDLTARIKDNGTRLINITPVTENFFDWLGVIESAKELHLIDSVYSNIVDQLNFRNRKNFYSRSPIQFTPILNSNWIFSGQNN